MGDVMQSVLRTPIRGMSRSRCLVCGFAEVRTDEVIDRGLILLAECPRCEHRWTSKASTGRGPLSVRSLSVRPLFVRPDREVDGAA